jgi:hypothetical protein
MTLSTTNLSRLIFGRLPALPDDLVERIETGKATFEDRQMVKEIYDQIRKSFENIEITFANQILTSDNTAWQHFQITAAMLGDSDDPLGVSVPRSVLTTKSQSPFEFNWWHAEGAARFYTVQLNAGSGVPGYKVVINPDHMGHNMTRDTPVAGSIVPEYETVARPHNAAGTVLQFGMYKPRAGRWEFWPSSVLIGGATAYLCEGLPMVKIL